MNKFIGKAFFPIVAVMSFFCGCTKNNQFEVTLNLDNADGQAVYLCKTVNGDNVVVDSAVVSDGKAVLTAPYDDPQIAVDCVGEGLVSGKYLASVVAAAVEYYIGTNDSAESTVKAGVLIP